MLRSRPLSLALVLALAAPAAFAQSVVLQDDFSSTASGWADNREATALGHTRGLGVYDDMGHFQMTPLEDNTMGLLPAPRQASGGDVAIRTTMFLYTSAGSGAAGVFCRAQDRDNFYGFLVNHGGAWNIVRSQDGDATSLASGALPPQVMPGAVDGVLEAECRGSTLTLRFNGKAMGSADDGTFAAGQSGLMVVGTDLGATNAQYDDFTLKGW